MAYFPKQIACDSAMRNPENIKIWEQQYHDALAKLSGTMPLAKRIIYSEYKGFCQYLQWIRVDALNQKDWAGGISDNSIYVDFQINFLDKSVEVHGGGFTYISDIDKQTPEFRYLAMHSIIRLAKANKVKGLRKSYFKTPEDLAHKISTAFNGIMEEVVRHTGGYPYKKGVASFVNPNIIKK